MLNTQLPQHAVRYLNQVLGDNAMHLADNATTVELPYFLQTIYEVSAGSLLGNAVTLACRKDSQPLAAQHIQQHLKQLRELLRAPVILALPDMSPGERKQLIQRDIAFVVPDRQLFAPQWGMVLSERFDMAHRQSQEIASPATQALLIRFLNQYPANEIWHPFENAAALGYAGMTATRAIRELQQFDLFELEIQGRAKYLKLSCTRRELWEKAKPYLRTPVQKRLWTYDKRILQVGDTRLAGETALAQLTMLNEPPQTVIALTTEQVQTAKQLGIFFEPKALADGVAVEVWRYLPSMKLNEKTADSLSLWLSLKDKPDDRIQLALDDLEEKFLW